MDAYLTWPHHLNHAAGILRLLPGVRLFIGHDQKMIDHARQLGLDHHLGLPPAQDRPVIVASGNELPSVKRAILLEHGIGQTYVTDDGDPFDHCCWPGGVGRENVVLFVCPNDRVAEANWWRYPNADCAVVGSPHVEQLREHRGYPLPEPRVAISTHWESGPIPELRSSFAHYQDVYEKLCRSRPEAFVMHGHPRHQDFTAWKAREWGVEFVADFADLTQRAWCYVTDNSSTLYEWAALDRPVVSVNAPWYRRQVEHGARFWDLADVGEQVFDPADLSTAIDFAMADLMPQRQRRATIVRHLFGADVSRGASQRAADAICAAVEAAA
jgi:hypothetical protein